MQGLQLEQLWRHLLNRVHCGGHFCWLGCRGERVAATTSNKHNDKAGNDEKDTYRCAHEGEDITAAVATTAVRSILTARNALHTSDKQWQ